MEKEECGIGFYIKVIQNSFRKKFNTCLREYGLTKTQMDVLIYLDQAEREDRQVIQRDLESYFHISNPTVSVMLDRLEAKGLVERIRSQRDKRVRYVQETEKARHLHERIAEQITSTEKEMLKGLSDQEIDEGKAFLQKIMNNLTGKEDICFDHHSGKAD